LYIECISKVNHSPENRFALTEAIFDVLGFAFVFAFAGMHGWTLDSLHRTNGIYTATSVVLMARAIDMKFINNELCIHDTCEYCLFSRTSQSVSFSSVQVEERKPDYSNRPVARGTINSCTSYTHAVSRSCE
jgi:hypothetical protein